MSDVSVIGLGNMGSALAQALLDGGYEVTVWNRTSSKADPLIKEGAVLAESPAIAIAASPIFIVCVLNYDVTKTILSSQGVVDILPGKTMIQLTGLTPHEARKSAQYVEKLGGDYLSGEIMVYPDRIGKPDATILAAGKRSVYSRCEKILKTLAGNTTYLGEQVGAPLAYGWAMGCVLYGSVIGALQGARICEVEGLEVQQFARGLQTKDLANIGDAIMDLLDRVQSNRFDASQANLRMGTDGAVHLLQYTQETGINNDIPAFFTKILKQGVEAGFGDEDMAAIIKVLRDKK